MPKVELISPIRDRMVGFSSLGEDVAKNGTVLYGKCPHIGKDAYLHTLYPALTDAEIKILEEQIERKLPQQLVDFYGECNGFHYFVDTLIVYGLRSIAGRGADAFYQPYDMRTPNVDERIRDADEDAIFFAWYDWDGSLVYTRKNESAIYMCGNDSMKPVGKWSSLKEFLSEESERVLGLFDSKGILLDESASTLPVR
ncbi:SMI1/KNR4 family protein [Burkholderia sp. BCC1999]|uniref:SMI1/KNR4 family protein n=1 Tax=Burkholderia sp. BCC1999 TaxID=2817448 RepID=UPI002AC3255D|nr:SMI1/KNR4 family protein [Burkholderia sp. BCC1999]